MRRSYCNPIGRALSVGLVVWLGVVAVGQLHTIARILASQTPSVPSPRRYDADLLQDRY